MYFLYEEEQTCAESLHLNATSILDFYQTNSDKPIFAQYLNCTFANLNFFTSDGTILFDNIIGSDNLPWFMARTCEDVVSLIEKAIKEFREAAIYCKAHPPAIITPFSIRKCIVKNYNPAPLEEF